MQSIVISNRTHRADSRTWRYSLVSQDASLLLAGANNVVPASVAVVSHC